MSTYVSKITGQNTRKNDTWVCPSIRFLDPPPPLLSILYMTIYFSANLLLFIFLLFRVRLG